MILFGIMISIETIISINTMISTRTIISSESIKGLQKSRKRSSRLPHYLYPILSHESSTIKPYI